MLLKSLLNFSKAEAALKTQIASENKSWAAQVAFAKVLQVSETPLCHAPIGQTAFGAYFNLSNK